MTTAPTLAQLAAGPATLDVVTACRVIGISPSYGYELIKSGAFPARVLIVGNRRRIITASLVELLSATDAA